MTAQLPDQLTYRGVALDLCAAPLVPYLEHLPKARRPRFAAPATHCHRGHVATWRVEAGKLWLTGLVGLVAVTAEEFDSVELADVFPDMAVPHLASWFSGRLRCIEGELLEYRHAGWASIYERDRLFDVEQGVVAAEWVTVNGPQCTEPVHYHLAPDGGRTCVVAPEKAARKVADPLSAADLHQPQAGSGFVVGGYMTYGVPREVEYDD